MPKGQTKWSASLPDRLAIVALGGNGYLQRKIDHHVARLDVLLQRILAQKAGAPATDKELAQ